MTENLGTMKILKNILDVEMVHAGDEGDVGALVSGDAMSSHLMRVPPGFYPAHNHEVEVMILFLKGRCEVFQGDGKQRRTMGPMSLLCVPKDEGIGMEVMGNEPCELILIMSPNKMNPH